MLRSCNAPVSEPPYDLIDLVITNVDGLVRNNQARTASSFRVMLSPIRSGISHLSKRPLIIRKMMLDSRRIESSPCGSMSLLAFRCARSLRQRGAAFGACTGDVAGEVIATLLAVSPFRYSFLKTLSD